MKERPILFSAPMVRAILSGKKTQTRRVCKPAATLSFVVEVPDPLERGQVYNGSHFGDEDGDIQFASKYGGVGDRLWVRETFYAWGRWETRYSQKKGRDEWHFVDLTATSGRKYRYAAEGDGLIPMPGRREAVGVIPGWWKRPAIFMPHRASRIALEISGVRVQRLQDISEADASAEGVAKHEDGKFSNYLSKSGFAFNAVSSFRSLWESINGADSWTTNPWVWAIEFRRLP